MAYESFPNDQHNARRLTPAEYEQVVAPWLNGFVRWNGSAPVYADSTGLQIKLPANISATISGFRFNNTNTTTVPIAANTSGKTRIDLVVLRLRRAESSTGAGDQNTITPVAIQGVPADNPVAPSPVQTDSTFWDLPVAEVTVANGAATIGSAQIKTRAYYVTGTGFTGREDWGFPPASPGVIFRANDTGVTYVGTSTGTWDRLYYNTGWVNITDGADKAGWEFRNFAVNRSGNLVVMTMYLRRSGAAVGASTKQYFGPVPAQFKPNRTQYGVAHITNPVHSVDVVAQDDGQILLDAGLAYGINTGGLVYCSLTWVAG